MPLYRYTAFDSSGTEHEGTINSTTAQEAARQVASRGLRVRMIQENKDTPPIPSPPVSSPPRQQPPKPQQPPQARVASQKFPRQPVVGQAPVFKPSLQINSPLGVATPMVHNSRPGSDRDRLFLFSQLAAGLRAGINPAELLNQIAPRTRILFKGSLQAMSAAASEGIPLSRVMAQYPDLYPQHVVGAMKAGEAGGFVPEACDMISQQAENAHKFKRSFWYVWFIFVNAFLSIPLIFVVRAAFMQTWREAERTSGAGGGAAVSRSFGTFMWQYIAWPIGPISLGVLAVLYLIWIYMGARASLRFRHKMGLGWPVFGARAKHENLTMFSWTMSKLTAAGLPYNSSWDLAAGSMPNTEMQKRLIEVGRQVSTAERMSDVFHNSKLFPSEYAPTMATAEYTGSIPAAMEQLSRTSRAEFEAQENYAKMRAGCWGALALIVSSAAVFFIFIYMWLYELPAEILKEDTPP